MKNNKDNVLKQKLASVWNVPPMPQGSRQRFLDKLKHDCKPRHKRRGLYIGLPAAVAAVVATLVMLIVKPETTEDAAPTHMELTIAEIKGYYKAKMWSESEYIIMLTDGLDEETRQSLLQEVNKLEQGSDSLAESLLEEPISDDLKIRYITQVYISHLRSMQQIHNMLNELTAQK